MHAEQTRLDSPLSADARRCEPRYAGCRQVEIRVTSRPSRMRTAFAQLELDLRLVDDRFPGLTEPEITGTWVFRDRAASRAARA